MILGLAPMDGFTDCAFRQITKEIFEKYGEKDKYEFIVRTEFMNADGYIINPTGLIKHLLTSTEQAPVIAQIFGANIDMLKKCFADIDKKYAHIFSGLELNMGCPAKNVMHTGGGGGLLRDKENTLNILQELRKIISLPFSFKTRTGLDDQDREEQMKFLVEASQHVDRITIHGRTVKQGYAGDADWSFVYALKNKANKKCKIIGNGSIKTYEDIAKFGYCHSAQGEEYNKNLQNTSLYPVFSSGGQCEILDGVLIGQAAIGNPWIFTPHLPTREEIKTTILRHLDYMISYDHFFQKQKANYTGILTMPDTIEIHVENPQNITLAEFRKHLFQYVKGIPESKEFKQRVSTILDYNLLVAEIQNFFG